MRREKVRKLEPWEKARREKAALQEKVKRPVVWEKGEGEKVSAVREGRREKVEVS